VDLVALAQTNEGKSVQTLARRFGVRVVAGAFAEAAQDLSSGVRLEAAAV
jgi:hypothetical protein